MTTNRTNFRNIRAIAIAATLAILPACAKSNSGSLAPNNKTPTTQGSATETRSTSTSPSELVHGSSYEMSCANGLRVTFNGGLKGNITVSDLPSNAVYTKQADDKHFNFLDEVIVPVTPNDSTSFLSSVNTGGPVIGYGLNISKTLLFDQKTNETQGQARTYITIPAFTNGHQLSRFATEQLSDLYYDRPAPTAEEKYVVDGINVVSIGDTPDGTTKIIYFPADPTSPKGYKEKPVTEDLGDQDHPTVLTHKIPDANGGQVDLSCSYYTFKAGTAKPPTIGANSNPIAV